VAISVSFRRLWQQNLLRIEQEALANTLKYARARRFETRLNFNRKDFRLELKDDGEGFTTTDRHDGLGFTGMRERVEHIGGTLMVISVPIKAPR
jgi:signal transduction histidine kinase